MTIQEAYTVLSNELKGYLRCVDLMPDTEKELKEALEVIQALTQTQETQESNQYYWCNPDECGGIPELIETPAGNILYNHIEAVTEQLYCSNISPQDASYLQEVFNIPKEMFIAFAWKDLLLFNLDADKLIKAFINLYY